MSKLQNYRPQSRNANKHNPRGMGELEQSIQSDGWIGAITVAADGETFDGSARLETLATAGLDEPIVVDVDGRRPVIVRRTDIATAEDERAKRLAIAANKIANDNLSWNAEILAELAQEIDLSGLFREDELIAILAELEPEIVPGDGGDEFDPTPADGPTRAQLGDLWIIGDKHRLLVGDCTDPVSVVRLMGGERAALCFTSPPYNSKSELHGNDKFRGSFYLDKNVDAMEPQEYRAFSRDVFFSIGLCVAEDGNICYNLSYNKNNRDGFIFVVADAIEAGFNLYETIAWLKTGMPNPASIDVLTRNYEFIFLLSRGNTYRTSKIKGEVRSNVWEINNAGSQQDNHKACFPIALPERAMREMTKNDDVIVDLFLGSGTTLIAAHRTGRRCCGMEISERYADVILRRAEAEGLTVARVEG